MQGTLVQSLGQEDPLEEKSGNLLQYSCLGSPWTEEPGRLQSTESQKSWTHLATEQQ